MAPNLKAHQFAAGAFGSTAWLLDVSDDPILLLLVMPLSPPECILCILYGLSLKTVKNLHSAPNIAARLLIGPRETDPIMLILKQLHWLPVDFHAQFKTLVNTSEP